MINSRFCCLKDILDDQPKLHMDEFGEPISWGLSEDVLYFLENRVDDTWKTLETGGGLSTILFALKGTTHNSIIPYQDEVERIQAYCVGHKISVEKLTFYVDYSENILPRLQLSDLDLVLIDGCHGFPAPFIDWYYASRALKLDGTLIVDDIQLWTGRVLKEFLASESGWQLETELSGKTAVFKKLEHQDYLGEWADQPYVIQKTNELNQQP